MKTAPCCAPARKPRKQKMRLCGAFSVPVLGCLFLVFLVFIVFCRVLPMIVEADEHLAAHIIVRVRPEIILKAVAKLLEEPFGALGGFFRRHAVPQAGHGVL